MAKKKNETLEQQRRAREEFLKLKKMQQMGESQSEPKHEAKAVQMTLAQRVDNFWYHNKWYVITLALAAIIIAIMVTQCVNKKEYDLQIVYFSYTATVDAQTQEIADYFGEYVTDINGDGTADVQVLNCSLNQTAPERSYRDSVLQKVQATVAGNNKALLYITDQDSMKYFDMMETSVPLFLGEPYALGEDFYKAVKLTGVPALPEGLQISIRNISGSMLEMSDTTQDYFNESNKILEALKANADKEK